MHVWRAAVERVAADAHDRTIDTTECRVADRIKVPWKMLLKVQLTSGGTFLDPKVSIRQMIERFLSRMTAVQVHQEWVAEMRVQGWFQGPRRSHDAKTHPLLAEWEHLLREDQAEYIVLGEAVKAAGARCGVERLPR